MGTHPRRALPLLTHAHVGVGAGLVIGRVLFVAVAVAVFIADRVTKLLVEQELRLGEQILVFGDIGLRHARNSGIAFGLLAETGSLVVVGSVMVAILMFVFMLRVDPTDLLTVLGGALITGGALGNLVDRVQHGHVVDFLHVSRFPTFNIADVAITCGVIAVVAGQLRAARHEQRAAQEIDQTGAAE